MNKFFTFLFVIGIAPAALANFQDHYGVLKEQASGFSGRTAKSCPRPIAFDVSEFEFERDELAQFQLRGIEQGQILSRLLGDACSRTAANRQILSRVGTVFMKRGSIGERKLVQTKSGDLFYFVENDPQQGTKNWDDILRADLVSVLKLDFKTSPTAEKEAAAKAESDRKDQERKAKQEVEAAAQTARTEKQKKAMAEAVAWYQNEIQLVMKKTPVDAKEIERVSKEYQEKIDAITKRP